MIPSGGARLAFCGCLIAAAPTLRSDGPVPETVEVVSDPVPDAAPASLFPFQESFFGSLFTRRSRRA